MAEKLVIEVFKTKSFEEFSKSIASEDCRAQSGTAAAATAALSCSLFCRAISSVSSESINERLDYLKRNCEILRIYMVHLVDEDVKCRAPLRRALSEGDERAIEAAYHTSCEINAEIINMMNIALELIVESCDYCSSNGRHLLRQSATLALAAVDVCADEILDICRHCTEDSFIYVSKRENEITRKICFDNYNSVLAKTEV